MIRIKVIDHAFPTNKKPSIFTYRKSHHLHVISGLPQEHEGMRANALTYLASVIDHMGLIQIHFSTTATVLSISKKQSTCSGSNRGPLNRDTLVESDLAVKRNKLLYHTYYWCGSYHNVDLGRN